MFEEARLAAAGKDLATAKAKATDYEKLVAPQERAVRNPAAARAGRTDRASAKRRYPAAVKEFELANQRDPRVDLPRRGRRTGAGDATRGAALARKAAQFNEISFNFAYVKGKAAQVRGTGVRAAAVNAHGTFTGSAVRR